LASVVVCEGVVSVLPDGSTTCSTGWATQLASIPFDISQIDPTIVAAMFGGGFVLFSTPWAVAWGGKQLLHLLK